MKLLIAERQGIKSIGFFTAVDCNVVRVLAEERASERVLERESFSLITNEKLV